MNIGLSILKNKDRHLIRMYNTENDVVLNCDILDIESNNIKIEGLKVENGEIKENRNNYPLVDMNRKIVINKDTYTLIGYYTNSETNGLMYVLGDYRGRISVLDSIENIKITNSINVAINLDDYELECKIVTNRDLNGIDISEYIEVDVYKSIIVKGDILYIDGDKHNISNITNIEYPRNVYKYKLRKVIIDKVARILRLANSSMGILEVQLKEVEVTEANIFMYLNNLEKVVLGVEDKVQEYGCLNITEKLERLKTIDIIGECVIRGINTKAENFDFRGLFSDERVILNSLDVRGNKVVKDLRIHKGYKEVAVENILRGTKLSSIEIEGNTIVKDIGDDLRQYLIDRKSRLLKSVEVKCKYDYPYKDLQNNIFISNVYRGEPTELEIKRENEPKRLKRALLYGGINRYTIHKDKNTVRELLYYIGKDRVEEKVSKLYDDMIEYGSGRLYIWDVGLYGLIYGDTLFEKEDKVIDRVILDTERFKVVNIKHKNRHISTSLNYFHILPKKFEYIINSLDRRMVNSSECTISVYSQLMPNNERLMDCREDIIDNKKVLIVETNINSYMFDIEGDDVKCL